ncbi:MAG: undecaprenyldiphospho-muramoylpentapeptide beta-N-acetylglucosaminyltransferase [Rhodospirillales bacterium]|nr:undecaprenyldiphospho-muramoylpentapeptide beta-N-acetylglucosaminyltransferase [Alphaproteobacteria bacterium]MBL6947290.1 undecaprenyldiphospho-muramoylpentapeptide beta-N-acetylglucosaminyltransferase [Rhodospirillales bacterium]
MSGQSATKPLVVLAAGGTGGHMFPAQALAAELAERGCRLALVTDRRGDAWQDASGAVETHRIRAGGLAGKSFVARLQSGPELAIGTWQARGLLKRLQPDAVIGFGGYASVPTMMAASFGGYHTAIHEQNAVLGRANRLLASRVECIGTSFEKAEGLPDNGAVRIVHTGMPVRPSVFEVRGRPYPALDSDGPISLLVLGGSQGARVFSDVVPSALALLDEDLRGRLRVAQQCRTEDLERVESFYRDLGIDADLRTFFDDVPDRLTEAHLVVCRSGASTVAEVLVVGRPAIMVPYPHAIDDHQTRNAHAIDEAGAGWLMPEDAFTPAGLAARLDSLFGLPAILEKAASAARDAAAVDAVGRLADMVFTLLPSNGNGDGDGNGGSDSERRAA